MALIVADSDVLIDGLQGREPAAGRLARELGTGSLATTAVSVFELLSGTGTDHGREQAGKLLAALRILGFDEAAARRASQVRRELERKGTAIGMADYLIAGICLSASAILLTRNRSHFDRVAGLRVESP